MLPNTTAKTLLIDDIRISYVSSTSPYAVLNTLWAQLLIHVARKDPTLAAFTDEQQERVQSVAEVIYETGLRDIQTIKAARDLSEFLLRNAAATQQAVKMMGELSQDVGRLEGELDFAKCDLDEALRLAARLAFEIDQASFLKRLVYLFTGRLA